MVTKRIIPCLDVKNARVVKGTNFIDLKDAGSAVELAEKYYSDGADELVFLDISATEEKRKTLISLVKEVAKIIRIPFTVGGGINSLDDIEELLKSGADKVSLNSAIVKDPQLITNAAKRFGSQAIVAAIDLKSEKMEGDPEIFYRAFINGGKTPTGLDGLNWIKEVENLGVGEILLTSIDKDGTREGFDIQLLKQVTGMVAVPVIASGGAGKKEDFLEAFIETNVDACLAAGLFHYNILSIKNLKEYLAENNIEVRV